MIQKKELIIIMIFPFIGHFELKIAIRKLEVCYFFKEPSIITFSVYKHNI